MITMELSPTWSELMEVASGIRGGPTYAPAPEFKLNPQTLETMERLKAGQPALSAFSQIASRARELLNRPAPHARKKPNLTISMLEALKHGDEDPLGHVGGDRGVKKALVCRNLAAWHKDELTAYITEEGKLLIRTQYEALKKVLPDNRSCAH